MPTDDHAPPAPPTFFEDLGRLPPGRHSVPTEEVVRQQKLRLMEGMLDAVGEQGYIATSVADVLKRAGVSRRTFYEHFGDKEDCFLQAFDHVTSILQAAVQSALERERDWRPALRTGLDLFLRTAAAYPRYARACLVEVLAVGPEGIRRRHAAMAPYERFLEAGRAAASGGVALPGVAVETYLGGILETISSRVMRDAADELPRLLDDLDYLGVALFVGTGDTLGELVGTPAAASR